MHMCVHKVCATLQTDMAVFRHEHNQAQRMSFPGMKVSSADSRSLTHVVLEVVAAH